MVMARVHVTSKEATGTVGKLSITSRGPYRVTKNHNNDSYSIQLFDNPQGVIRKFFAQDLYALPPQILPCDAIDLPYLRYFNTDLAPVNTPLSNS